MQNRLQLSGAFFYTKNENVIFVVDATAVPPIFNQDDGQLVKGVALALIGDLTPRWNLNLSLQYLDATLDTQNAVNDGKRLTLTPEFSGSLWTTVRLARDIRVGGGIRYTDPVFINAANTIQVPRYTVADVLIEAPIARQLMLRLNVYNLTDKVYIRSINNNGGRYIYPARRVRSCCRRRSVSILRGSLHVKKGQTSKHLTRLLSRVASRPPSGFAHLMKRDEVSRVPPLPAGRHQGRHG